MILDEAHLEVERDVLVQVTRSVVWLSAENRRARVIMAGRMKPVHIIGAPLDLGGGRRGVDMGPSALRIAGIGEQIAALGYTVVDKGDLPGTGARRPGW